MKNHHETPDDSIKEPNIWRRSILPSWRGPVVTIGPIIAVGLPLFAVMSRNDLQTSSIETQIAATPPSCQEAVQLHQECLRKPPNAMVIDGDSETLHYQCQGMHEKYTKCLEEVWTGS